MTWPFKSATEPESHIKKAFESVIAILEGYGVILGLNKELIQNIEARLKKVEATIKDLEGENK